MDNKKRIILVSHCVLNKCSKVERTLPKERADTFRLVEHLMKKNIGIMQLPCPEMHMYGIKRWGHVKAQFDTKFFRENSVEMLTPIIGQLTDYLKNGYEVIGVVGINGSPSCGVSKVCDGKSWGGEFEDMDIIGKKVKSLVYTEGSGVFMEELMKLFEQYNIDVPFYAIEGLDVDTVISSIK
ncbi:CD3072 family TudS-related putative desulfidase [Brassicibacter mesophilus]|uniref:CD3072 family TudS-related putative desulfidase n=1 Tax=Brassicibacter mesophilus TaxID=745119 RepID=UPI003D1E47DA